MCSFFNAPKSNNDGILSFAPTHKVRNRFVAGKKARDVTGNVKSYKARVRSVFIVKSYIVGVYSSKWPLVLTTPIQYGTSWTSLLYSRTFIASKFWSFFSSLLYVCIQPPRFFFYGITNGCPSTFTTTTTTRRLVYGTTLNRRDRKKGAVPMMRKVRKSTHLGPFLRVSMSTIEDPDSCT